VRSKLLFSRRLSPLAKHPAIIALVRDYLEGGVEGAGEVEGDFPVGGVVFSAPVGFVGTVVAGGEVLPSVGGGVSPPQAPRAAAKPSAKVRRINPLFIKKNLGKWETQRL